MLKSPKFLNIILKLVSFLKSELFFYEKLGLSKEKVFDFFLKFIQIMIKKHFAIKGALLKLIDTEM